MRAARARRPRRWGRLPEKKIVFRLLHTSATAISIAAEYGCSYSTICVIFRKHTTKEQRLEAKARKQSESLSGYKHAPEFGKAVSQRVSGVNNPFYGKKHTEESRRRQSAAKKGKKQALEQRIAQSARMQGVPLEKWQGFASSEAERLANSIEWKTWRNAVFTRDNWTCQCCGENGGRLHPHHIKPRSTSPETTFSPENGITLCVRCHRETDSYGVNLRYRQSQ